MTVWHILLLIILLLIVLQVYPLIKMRNKVNVPGIGFWSSLRVLASLKLAPAMYQLVQKNQLYKGFYFIWLGQEFTLVTADPECAQWMLVKNKDLVRLPTLTFPSHFMKEFGENVGFVDKENWKKQRTIANNSFNIAAYQNYFPIFNEVMDKFMTILATLPEGDIDIATYLSKFTVDLLGKSIFHYDFNHMSNEKNPNYEAYQTTLAGGIAGQIIFKLFPYYESLPLPGPQKFVQATQTLKNLFKSVLEEHQKQENTYKDILDNLLKSEQLTEREIYSNIWAFFLAGHETTSAALSWAMVELADKQDIQEKLYQAIQGHYPDLNPSFESIQNPPLYLDCFIKENLRQHPPAHFIPSRKALTDYTVGNQMVPAGARLGIDIYGIHHNPDYWKNPELFDPERFFPENRKGQHKFAYLPFSLGQRQCIGNEFSEIQQRLLLVKFVKLFKVLPPRNGQKTDLSQIHQLGIVSSPFNVRLEKR